MRITSKPRLIERLARPPAALIGAAISCVVVLPVVAWLGRDRTTTFAALAALVGIAAACGALAATWREHAGPARRWLQTVAGVVVGLAAAAPGWFFGPLSVFAAALALVLVLVGVMAPRHGASGWLICVAIVGGQAAVFALVATGRLPDTSIERVRLPGISASVQIAVAVMVAFLLFSSFLAGRGADVRYRALASNVDDAVRSSAVHQALIDEARADYKRALAAGRRGVHSGRAVGGFRIGELLGGRDVYDAIDVDQGLRVAVVLEGDGATQTARVVDTQTARGTDTQVATGPRLVPVPDVAAVDLELAIRTRGALAPAEARAAIDAAAAALAALHTRGTLHLEVRPSTIVRDDGGWRLLDVAAASAGPPDTARLRFMAPERLGGAFAEARADVYGLAATAYAALSGRPPFAEVADSDLPRAVVVEMPSDPGLDAEVGAVLRIGLAREPAQRFATVDELRAALAAALDGAAGDRVQGRAESIPPWRGHAAAASASAERKPVAAAGPRPRRETTRSEVWHDAYRAKMREFNLGMFVYNAFTAPWVIYVVRSRIALVVVLAAMAGQLASASLHYVVSRRRDIAMQAMLPPATGSLALAWPWAIIGALSVVPSYAIGLHAGMVAVMASFLFAGGLFRSEDHPTHERALVAGSVIGTHAVLFALVMTGVLPDLANSHLAKPDLSAAQVVALELVLLASFAAAVVAGRVIDARTSALGREAEAAIRKAAAAEAQLVSARSELAAVLDRERSGIFSGLRIGDYQLGRLLGRGGMGEVYEATAGGTRIALKLMRGDRVAQPDNLRLFVEEADALGRIRSPYVARVLAVGGIEAELPYLAMEYINGSTLSDILRDRQRLSFDEAGALIRDIARGLADVHAAGVLHLDLKPQNVIRADGRWKLVDFGVARLAGADHRRWVLGTPSYMAPEQAVGDPVDARADLYSLSAIAYRALTGRTPYAGKTPAEVARAAQAEPPPDPQRIAAMPKDVAIALRVGLAVEPDDRYATARELDAAFADAFAGNLSDAIHRRAHRLPPWRRAPAILRIA